MILDLPVAKSADPKRGCALQLSRPDWTDELSLSACRQAELLIG